MASAISHAVAALSIGTCFYRPQILKRVWVAGMICSALPDLDVIGFKFGIHYGDFWGHRGFTHSLVFAVLMASIVAFALLWRRASGIGLFGLFAYLLLATASHGVLDAMTNGGLGVAFFSPFDNTRYFLPWRPILVSPVALTRFFSPRGYAILRSELLWIWLPAILFGSTVVMLRRKNQPDVAMPNE
jgi:inner membrane protein